MFSGCTVPPDSKEIKLGNTCQEASLSPGKNARVVLLPCLWMEVHPYSYFSGVDISEVPGCHLLGQMGFQ